LGWLCRFFFVSFVCFVVASSWAATELHVGNVFAVPGDTTFVPVRLTSDTNVVAVQFDLGLGDPNLTAGEALRGAALADHLVVSGDPGSGWRRFVVHSPTNAAIANGTLVRIPLTLGSNLPYGALPLWVTNVVLATYDGIALTNASFWGASLVSTSSAMTLPNLERDPVSRVVYPGAPVTLAVSATGSPPLTFQWWLNGSNGLAGATNTTLTFPSVSGYQAGDYRVTVSNAFGLATSEVANLTVVQPLLVSVQGRGTVAKSPDVALYDIGQAVTLSATPARWYALSRWSDGVITSNRSITIGLTNTYTAIFEPSQPLEKWTNWTTGETWEVPVGTPKILIDSQLTFGGSFTFTSTNAPLVDLQTSFPGGTIFYALDGSDPLGGAVYDGTPFVISKSVVLRAVAFDSTYTAGVEADPVTITIIPVYSLALATNGLGSVHLVPPGAVYLSNTLVTLTATPTTGWGFLGWSGDVTGRTMTVTVRLDGNRSAQASFYQIPIYGLTLVTNGNGAVTVDPPGGSYLSNTVVNLSATPAPEWFFNGWVVDWGGAIGNWPGTNLDLVLNQPATVTAIFGAVPRYWLSASTPGGGTVAFSPTNNPFLSNSVVTLTAATTNAGWTFLGWTGDATGTNPVVNVTMDRVRNVQAVFGTALTTTPIGSGSIQRLPPTAPYPYASTVRLSAVPNAGNYFRFWGGSASGLSNSPLSFVVTNANPTVSAVFAVLPTNQHSLTVLVTGDGAVTKTPQMASITRRWTAPPCRAGTTLGAAVRWTSPRQTR
jgi:uncharacterized repeat protein (TIGR02543 family)